VENYEYDFFAILTIIGTVAVCIGLILPLYYYETSMTKFSLWHTGHENFVMVSLPAGRQVPSG
jgi:hypothetical protein